MPVAVYSRDAVKCPEEYIILNYSWPTLDGCGHDSIDPIYRFLNVLPLDEDVLILFI